MTDLVIDHVGAQGDGVAVAGGGRVYVPGTLKGERISAEVKGDRGRLVDVLTPSSDRVEPPCRHFGACGGCALQHMGEVPYKEWKTERVARALSHRGFEDVPFRPLVVTPPGSRRRARLTAIATKSGTVLGYNTRQSRQVVDISECPVLRPEIVDLFAMLRAALADLMRPGDRGHVQVTASDTGVDLVLDLPGDLDLVQREALGGFAHRADLARVSWGPDGEPVVERRRPVISFGDVAVAVPPGAFLQTSKEAEQAMAGDLCEILTGTEAVADLFSGLGTFSFPLARRARVTAFDGDGSLIGALDRAGAGLPVDAHIRDLFREPLMSSELARFDGVVLDPPRAGAKAQVAELAVTAVPVVAMVSCNPATFARDARALVDGGYRLQWVRPVDQFLWSADVELVASFARA